MDSKEIDRAMRDRLPVVYDGKRFEYIKDYISWYDDNRRRRLSVLLIDSKHHAYRVPADKVELADI